MDRRSRLHRDRFGIDQCRMKRAVAFALLALLSASISLRAGEIPPDQRRSGASFMTADTKAMQDDDTANPGMLWVLEGEGLWAKKDGASEKSCADCHGDARDSMKGVA